MAQISKPPIPLTMYKHFAVATVTLTACIAMFADSDNREAMAEEVEEHQQQEVQPSSEESDSRPELVRRCASRSPSGQSTISPTRRMFVSAPVTRPRRVKVNDTPGTNTIVEHHQEITEQFIPASELEAVFNRDQRGVLMKRDEFKALLEQARTNVASTEIPVPILIVHAQIKVTPRDQQAIVTMEFKVRQYAQGWQTLAIRAGNLLVEKIEIDNKPALTGRDPSDPGQLLLVHDKVGAFTVVATMSTPLVTVGSDRSAAFDLPVVAATQLNVACPAGRHLRH